MKTFTFTGKVLPERASVNLTEFTLPEVEFKEQKDGRSIGKITISISHSQVSVHVEGVEDSIDIFSLKQTIENLVRGTVDLIGYKNGCSYDLEITQATDEKGHQEVFGVQFFDETPEDGRKLPYIDLLYMTLKDTYFRNAIEDLRKAGRYPFDTPFHAYRAVEDVRQFFVNTFRITDKGKSWIRMKGDLRIGDEWITPLKNAADPGRHGEAKSITTEQRRDYLKRAFRVIDRFCEFLKQDSKPLGDEYPVLKDE